MKYASIGSISQGTLRSEDLLESFSSELDYQLKRQPRSFKRAPYRRLILEAAALLGRLGRDEDDDLDADDSASELVNEFQDALGEFAPPYGYFGTSEGDGADFGFYVTDPRESDFDGMVVDDLSEVPSNYRGEVLHISDHGNMSLYVRNSRGKYRDIWGVV